MQQITRCDCDMIYVIACALHSQNPDKEKMKADDLKALYKNAAKHSLTSMVYMALEMAGVLEGEEQAWIRQWKDEKDKAIRKNLLFDTERKQILALMEEAGIWYMPLKGSILKDYYPKYGMRQMSDNDILYDARYAKELRDLMKKRGYKVEIFGRSNQDVYMKPPIYNFEMHNALFHKSERNKYWLSYYGEIKEKLLPDEGRKYGYHFCDEDFYIYMMAHAYKHFSGGGTGLRTLVDLYVFLQKKEDALDWAYVRKELQKLGMLDFEKMCCDIAKKIFSPDMPANMQTLTDEEKTKLGMFLYAGTYGTVEQYTKNALRQLQPGEEPVTGKVKIRYCLSRIFPGREWCRMNLPFFDRHPYLIPALWIFRIFRAIFCNRTRIKAEMETVRKS